MSRHQHRSNPYRSNPYRSNPYRYGANLRPPLSHALPPSAKDYSLVARGTHPASEFPLRTDLPVSTRFAHGEIEVPRALSPEDAAHFGLTFIGGSADEPGEDESVTRLRAASVSAEGEEQFMGQPVFLGDERKFPGVLMRCIYCLLDAETPATLENCQELGGLLTSDDELAEAASALPPALYRAHLVYAVPAWNGWSVARVCKTANNVRVE